MSLLLIRLPPGAPGVYAWAISHDGQGVAAHGQAGAGLLPAAGRGVEVVAVAPASQLSWHRVTLPKGVGAQSARLRPVLAALLEEHLLDEAEALHFALEPGARPQTPAWVAVCRRDWLAAHVQALQATGRAALRIVPELAPQAGAARLTVTGTPEHAQVLVSGGDLPVQALPLAPAALSLLPGGGSDGAAQVQSEPAVAALAEQLLRQPVAIVQPAARLLAAAASLWDLAQLEFAQSGRARGARRLAALRRELLHAPRWRPARWGVALLLLVHLAGINVLAWQTKADLARRQAAVRAVFTESFPKVPVVVDAPAQMAREVALLRQRSGATSPRDLEPFLSAFGTSAQSEQGPTALEFIAGELRAKGVQMSAEDLAAFNQSLSPLGYRASAEENGLRLQVQQP
ncbi:MAG: general secretion pathway protein GspL [Burkholderiaceae bacterium]|jgi:general secretion pathway protein L|nr:general secretion pathway protein GspL [Burkholderiaceae bacterium]